MHSLELAAPNRGRVPRAQRHGKFCGKLCIAQSPDRARLVTGGFAMPVTLWDVATGAEVWSCDAGDDARSDRRRSKP